MLKRLNALSLDNSDSESEQKPVCKFGSNCYRQNPEHFEKYYHPAASDDEIEYNSDSKEKPHCKYGSNCYRQNPEHFENYYHPPQRNGANDNNSEKKIPCKYGSFCYRMNSNHRDNYSHPEDAAKDTDVSSKKNCRYGIQCRDRSSQHRKDFSHPSEELADGEQAYTPSYWPRAPFTNDHQEISIAPKSPEFRTINLILNSTIGTHGDNFGTINGKDPMGFIVTEIRRVLNKNLWADYCFKKKRIVHKNNDAIRECRSSKYFKQHPFVTPLLDENANEYWLFHGCSKETLDILTHKGYDPRVSSVDGMFGGGFYLAENSSKANQYIPCPQCGNNCISSKSQCTCSGHDNIVYSILVFRAILGDVHIVHNYDSKYRKDEKGPVRRPPTKNDDGDIFDSVLGEGRDHGGDSLNYREVILYESGQGYPEYIINFKRSLSPSECSSTEKSALDQCYSFLHRNK